MSDLKTRENDASVEAFLATISDPAKQADSRAIVELMREATGEEPKMWGDSIIGFGRYHYHYASGREGDWMLTGFSPRKQNLTLYIMAGFDHYEALRARLGKHKVGKSCLYINHLSDVDPDALRELVAASTDHMRRTNP